RNHRRKMLPLNGTSWVQSFARFDLAAVAPSEVLRRISQNFFSAKIGSFDRYVFVTPEYNHGISGALKNAIDFLFREWNDKAAGFVSYGGAGGARAVEQLRLVLAEVQMATVRNQVLLSMFTDFENFSVFKPDARHEKSANEMFDQVIAWGGALKALREN